SVFIGWIPGHVGIPGIVYVEREAKRIMKTVHNPVHVDGVTFGIRNDMIAREVRRSDWMKWHKAQGHGYYERTPRKPRHLRGLSHLNLYTLVRIRSGTDIRDHDDCNGHDMRFHLVYCPRFADGRPDRETLFDDKALPLWADWWRSHDFLGYSIQAQKPSLGTVQIVGGNPSGEPIHCPAPRDSTLVPATTIRLHKMCPNCSKVVMGDHRCRKIVPKRRGTFDYLPMDWDGPCYVCHTVVCKKKDVNATWLRKFVCVCGAEFALASGLSTHVECMAECFEVWKSRYIRDMKLLEDSFSREDGGLEPLPDMIVMGGEDALLPGSLVERAPLGLRRVGGHWLLVKDML
ncbi:hypothetical protein L873DRAFT_1796497, partial [Choiromyces venosus 120613-1]